MIVRRGGWFGLNGAAICGQPSPTGGPFPQIWKARPEVALPTLCCFLLRAKKVSDEDAFLATLFIKNCAHMYTRAQPQSLGLRPAQLRLHLRWAGSISDGPSHMQVQTPWARRDNMGTGFACTCVEPAHIPPGNPRFGATTGSWKVQDLRWPQELFIWRAGVSGDFLDLGFWPEISFSRFVSQFLIFQPARTIPLMLAQFRQSPTSKWNSQFWACPQEYLLPVAGPDSRFVIICQILKIQSAHTIRLASTGS